MTKRVDLSLTIDLPPEHEADRVSVGQDGRVRVFDKTGKEVIPKRVERAVHYGRPKGLKHQSRSIIDRNYASVGGLEQLAHLESFIVIDTNSIEIEGTKVSAAFFIACRLIAEKNGFRVESLDGRGHVYEFHNVTGNPEMLAILRIAHDTERGRGVPDNAIVGFVTDSEMGSHEAISKQKLPIYALDYLPKGFALTYASAETGQELANRLIRFCDKESTKYLARLKEGVGTFRKTGLASLEEDQSVRFRYIYYPDLKITNPVVTGVATTPETTYSIQFSEDSNNGV